ncbi:hypothetical protein [Parasphingorhabdus sp. NYA22]
MSLAGQWLSIAPHQPAVDWRPAFLPLDPTIQLTKGSPIDFSLHRPLKGFLDMDCCNRVRDTKSLLLSKITIGSFHRPNDLASGSGP